MASGATGTYGLPYPLQTDGVDVAADVQALATAVEIELLLKAPLDSPTFIGNPTAPTPSNSDNDTSIATTAFVKNQSYLTTTAAASTYAPLIGPVFTSSATINNAPLLFGDGTANEGRFVAATGIMYIQAGQSSADTTGALVVSRNTTTATNIAYFDVYADSHYISGITGIGTTASSSTRLNLTASTTSVSPIRIPHGTAPSAPVNGDIWTTTVGMYARINGNTIGPFGTGANWQSATPSPAITGMLWVDSDTDVMYIYNGSAWYSPMGIERNVATITTNNYTLVLSDRSKLVEMNNGVTANTLTIPLNSSVAFPIGTQITVLQTATGQTTLTPTGGVTLNGTPGLKLRAQWSSATIIKRDTDTWVAIGDLAA